MCPSSRRLLFGGVRHGTTTCFLWFLDIIHSSTPQHRVVEYRVSGSGFTTYAMLSWVPILLSEMRRWQLSSSVASLWDIETLKKGRDSPFPLVEHSINLVENSSSMPEWTYLGKDREGMWTRQLSLPIEGDLSNQESRKVSPMSSGNDPFDSTHLSWISAWCSAKSSSL